MSDLQLNNVSYIICETKKVILEKINLSVEKKETVTIVGLSGSGKTTLLKIIAGLIAPTTGDVFIESKHITKYSRQQVYKIREQMGFMFQNAALISNLNVYDNVALPLRYHTILNEDEIFNKIKRWFDMVGLEKNIHTYPAELNISERKIVGFIRTIISSPKYIFLDEPTSNLDFRYKDFIKHTLQQLSNNTTTTVITTNDIKWASEISDRFVVLDSGKIEFEGIYDNMCSDNNRNVVEIIKHIGG